MNLKEQISQYLSTQKVMSVATYGDTPWIASVYYVHDKDLNLYFLSKKICEHSKAIESNPNVAVSIADSHQPIHLPQKGIQLYGIASIVDTFEKLEWMFKMWNKLIVGENGEKLNDSKKFLEIGVSNIYKITPKRIKYMNSEIFPKGNVHQVLEF